jgi:DNA-binding transcriptional ArsR family regulator
MPSSPVLDRTFAALADPTRRAILERLSAADRITVSALATPFAMSLPAVLKHVGVLAEAGLVTREKIGRVVYCRIEPAPLRDMLGWLARYHVLGPERREAPAKTVAPSEKKPDPPSKRAARGRKKATEAAVIERRRKKPAATKAAKPLAAAKRRRTRTPVSANQRRVAKRLRGAGRRR